MNKNQGKKRETLKWRRERKDLFEKKSGEGNPDIAWWRKKQHVFLWLVNIKSAVGSQLNPYKKKKFKQRSCSCPEEHTQALDQNRGMCFEGTWFECVLLEMLLSSGVKKGCDKLIKNYYSHDSWTPGWEVYPKRLCFNERFFKINK